MELLSRSGVNHIDTAAAYGDSELRLAPWLARHRDSVFLATKTGDRSGPAARASLERSLERLGVDRVDLIQLHNLVEPEEFEEAHAPGGAVAALARARDEGLTRFLGVTGHGLRIARMHVQSLGRFDFDSVLLPFNHALLALPEYRRDVDELLELCGERQVAVQTIKSVARRRWPAGHVGPRYSWYEPVQQADAIARAVGYVLDNEQLFLNTSSDLRLLESTLDAAEAHAEGRLSVGEAALVADERRLGIEPLFDGGALDRI